MDLYLKILSGPRANDVFKIQDGLTLGRSKASIHIKDPKSSSLHGKIEKRGEAFVYLDQKSTNGTYSKGLRIDVLNLVPGTRFSIGSTEIEVVSSFEIKKSTEVNLSEWREKLFNFTNLLSAEQRETPLQPLSRLISVKIKSGVGAGKNWILGYGPRAFGPNNPDLCLLDPNWDETLFLLKDAISGLTLQALLENKILFNGVKRNDFLVSDPVEIQINDTILELKLIDENS